MRQALTLEEFNAEIFGADNYAWRWEQQPAYWVGRERAGLDAFLAGTPRPATDNPSSVRHLEAVRRMTGSGRRYGRVRVIDQPPTDYQRWLHWMDRWSREAGEEIHYLSRPLLRQLGRPPLEPESDWWLIDGERLIVIRFDADGRPLEQELFVDEPEVRLARLWRLAAISWATAEEEEEAAAAQASAA